MSAARRKSSNWWIKTARYEDHEVEATMAARLKAMPTSPLSVVIRHLLADFGPDGDGMTDGELLARFLRSRDEDALAALVRRHAPMVWGVCRRLLNHHDAEDAFQATFLVLVRKAAGVPRQAVANWLYGVARQTAVRLRAMAAKRGRRERQVANMPEPTVAEVRDADWQTVLDEELSRLPDHYRGVVVLCDLEGVTRKEAARQLGIPEGSVASRLARARAYLAKRLTHRGVVLSGGSVAAVLSAGSASASAPPVLVASTIKAASLLAAGRAAGVSARVAALTEGVVQAMFVTRLKGVLAVVLVIAAFAGAAGLLYQTQAAGQQKAKEESLAFKKDEKPGEEKQAMTKEEKLRVLIDKVLAAHGGEDKLNKLQFTMTVKHSNGITVQYFIQPPDHFRSEEQQPGEATKLVTILFHNHESDLPGVPQNGRAWWRKHPNGEAELVHFLGNELRMEYHLDYVKFFGPRRVLRLKDTDHRVTLLDEEVKIDGRAAVGMEVTKQSFPNWKVRMYFDKETHLLVKQTAFPYSVTQGFVTYSDYKKFDGIPIAQKEHDGYLEPVVTEFRAVEKFDAKLFEEP
jgi:RNA polymerase sigma factor (sigma-70 family)